MSDYKIDETLSQWSEINATNFRSLLLGNGFSMNVWSRFEYRSLFEVATSGQIRPELEASLFDRLGTKNFEDVLRALYYAAIVDEQIGSPEKEKIALIYTNTKKSLAASVNYVHVSHSLPAFEKMKHAFHSYDRIYTTNYDLIPYWTIMHGNDPEFKDLFWGHRTTFDPNNKNVVGKAIYYLHGALHLVELPDGTTRKIRANGLSSLVDLFELHHPEQFPLIISEASWQEKLNRIKRNDYLRNALEVFESEDQDLVVLGHSLHRDYDQHLTDAISASPLAKVAIGVWPGQPPGQILEFKARITNSLQGKEVSFFNSTTHPLGLRELNCGED